MIPLKKTAPIIDKFNELVNTEPTEFDLARLNSEIKKYSSSATYNEIQQFYGMFASLTKDVELVKKHFNAAVKNSGDDPDILFNYAVSLSNLCLHVDAVEIANKVFEQSPDDIPRLKFLVEIYSAAFDYKGAKLALDRLINLGVPEDNSELSSAYISIIAKENILHTYQADWKDVSARALAVTELIRAHNFKIYAIEEYIDDDSVFLEFTLNTNQENLIKVDYAITEMLAELPYSPLDDFLSFSCTSFSAERHFAS